MIIDKPTMNRNEVLTNEARESRIQRQLKKVSALLVEHEELAPPVRQGDTIQMRIIRRKGAVVSHNDVLAMLADPS